MKTKLLALALLAGGSLFAETRFSISIGTGGYDRGYYPPAPYAVVQPPCPGPGYNWVEGYYGDRHAWVPGYWARPSYYREDGHDRARFERERFERERYARERNERERYDRERYRDNDRDRRYDNGYDQ